MTTAVTTDQDLRDLLGTLGDTADDIEATLLTADCRGIRFSAIACPVANWLTEHVERLELATAHTDLIQVWVWSDSGEPPHWITVRPPAALSVLIAEFDAGRRPHLIKQESEALS